MGFRQVNFYSTGNYNPNPCNQVSNIKYLEVGAVGGALVYLIFVLLHLLDDGIRSNEDVEKYLGLSVLGEIPNIGMSSDKKYGYYSYSPEDKKGLSRILKSGKQKKKKKG